MNWIDTLQNLVSGLFTAKDKTFSNSFVLFEMSRSEIDYAYRGDWVCRKAIDIIPFDTVREWRHWQATADQITTIEAVERSVTLPARLMNTHSLARLYGGALLYMSVDQGTPDEPLEIERVKKGALKYVLPLHRYRLSSGELEDDVLSPYYQQPRYYEVSGSKGIVRIHPSRVVRMIGNAAPEPMDGWGDSLLLSIRDAVQHVSMTAQSIASLVSEAKFDIIHVPDLMETLVSPDQTSRLSQRFTLANTMKSINNTLLLDANETFERKDVKFSDLPELLATYLQIASGAVDIPITRFLGQSPAGLNSTGEGDLKNYYDRVASEQKVCIGPLIAPLDEVIIRSALGNRPPEIFYNWAPLWQMDPVQRATMIKSKADATQVYINSGLVDEEVLAQGTINQLIEDGVYPGLEQMIRDAPAEPIVDAAPRTLYISRRVLNVEDIRRWAKSQGFETTVEDLHVTLIYSRQPVDWMKMGSPWSDGRDGRLVIPPGGARLVEKLGTAIVLLFSSSELSWRHEDLKRNGASFDYDQYQPHISLTYQDLDFSSVTPYRDEIVLGPEVFEEVNEEVEINEV